MESASRSPRYRTLVPALLSIAVLGYVLAAGGEPDSPPSRADDTGEPDDKLRVEWVDPVELSPGAAVIAHVHGAESGEGELRAHVSARGVKADATILHRSGQRVVVQMPRGLPRGTAKLRVMQGERRSKPRLLQIRPVPMRDVLRDLLGGLALFVLGLRMLGQAFRSYAGQRVRDLVARLTGSPARSVGLGIALGGVTQSTTSSAGLLTGLLGARMLRVHTALGVLIGVQLGAASAGVLLPLVATREALWVIVLGAVWLGFAGDRHARAFGNIVLGCGLLFLGLALLQTGFRPLLASPELLPHLHHLRVDGPLSAIRSALVGALLCGLLQGPGPVFALVLSLSESSGLIGLLDGLAIVAGTALGAVLGTLAVGLPLGRRGRRLAMGHLLLALTMTVVAVAGLPLWHAAALALAPGDPTTIDYGTRALLPRVGVHLAVGFAVCQLAAAASTALLIGPIARLNRRFFPARTVGSDPPEPNVEADDAWVARPLLAARAALVAVDEVLRTRERVAAVTAERALSDVRDGTEQMLQMRGAGDGMGPTLGACLHLGASLDQALRVAETALERNFTVEAKDAELLARLNGLLLAGMDALIARASGDDTLLIDEARAREIELNGLEDAARREATRLQGVAPKQVPYRLWLSELLVAYETVGNHLYRLATRLADDDDF